MDKSVLFAHHARGCTIVAAKIYKNVIIYQNVTISSNLRYNKVLNKWENIGSPILAENVIVADGVNQYKTKNPDYDLVFSSNMITGEEIMRIDTEHVIKFNKSREIKDKN